MSYGVFSEIGCSAIVLPGVLSARNGIGAGIALEEVVEAAVLLNDVDDVLDLSGRRSSYGAARLIAPPLRMTRSCGSAPSVSP